MATATKKSDIDPNFKKQLTKMRQLAEKESTDRVKGEQIKWMMPDKGEWDGDLTDLEGISKAFKRDKANEDFIKACNPSSPGVTGDGVATTTQIDVLSAMERAFRMRHTMSFPRAIAHMVARRGKGQAGKRGHGGSKGVFAMTQDYISGVLKQAGS